MANILTKLLTLGEGRQLREFEARRRRSTRSSPTCRRSPTTSCARKTAEFRSASTDGESLDDLLPEAFAACREAAVRALGMRHFDVQLIGGMVLNAA